MMEEISFIVDESMVNERIDKVLLAKAGFSRTRIQKLIEDGLAAVNEETVKSNYRLKLNDEVILTVPEAAEYKVEAVKMDLNIVYEDDDIIVIDKPRGLIVHPTHTTTEATLVNGVLYHCRNLSGINGVLRPGVVHRIDKNTTGLIIMAKNDKAHTFLSEQLADKTMSRKYYALVHGVIPHDVGTVDAPIGRDPKDRQKMTVTDRNSKEALTKFFVLERFEKHTLLECHLMTGRTHQIRVHMEYIRHPLVNDTTYTSRKLKGSGQLLHAFELTFIHPSSRQRMTLTCPRPGDFEEYLTELRERERING